MVLVPGFFSHHHEHRKRWLVEWEGVVRSMWALYPVTSSSIKTLFSGVSRSFWDKFDVTIIPQHCHRKLPAEKITSSLTFHHIGFVDEKPGSLPTVWNESLAAKAVCPSGKVGKIWWHAADSSLFLFLVNIITFTFDKHMGVSEIVVPKSSILIGFSIINHPFWGTLIFGNTHIHVPSKSHMFFFVGLLWPVTSAGSGPVLELKALSWKVPSWQHFTSWHQGVSSNGGNGGGWDDRPRDRKHKQKMRCFFWIR